MEPRDARAFPGHPLAGGRVSARVPELVDAFGRVVPRTDDPAFQPPTDPARGLDKRATVRARNIPDGALRTGWTISQVRSAIQSHTIGLFADSSQLADVMLSDSRVKSSLSSLHGGLFAAPIRFSVPKRYRKSKIARECCRAFEECWPQTASEAAMSELDNDDEMKGFGIGQLTWDLTGDYATPVLEPWNTRFTYWHWLLRCYVSMTLDGQMPVTGGNGQWVLHAPHGEERGWLRGSLWSISPWWLARNLALRDWARYCERHGMPIIVAKTPAAGDDLQIQDFIYALSTMGQENVVQVPQGTDAAWSYGLELLEATDTNWQGFQKLIDACSMEITLAIMSQNLTTEIKEGSYAAARVHGDVRQTKIAAKARGWQRTIYSQIARPFAAMNFGDPDIAPLVKWDVSPPEDKKILADTFSAFGMFANMMRLAGYQMKNPRKVARGIGIDIGVIVHVDPLQVAAKKVMEGDEPAKGEIADA